MLICAIFIFCKLSACVSCYGSIFLLLLIFVEINQACADVRCQNGGSCIFTNETNNASCSCNVEFGGRLCQGITIVYSRSFDLKLLPIISFLLMFTFILPRVLNIYPIITQMQEYFQICVLEHLCGVAPILISKKRIVGGVEALAHSWPWQVSLQKDGKSLSISCCEIV